jgi:uncharacterized protein YeaO (DUF488 family)
MKKLYTIQIAKQRLLEFSEIVFVDTTVKSGNKAFAPTWDIVLDYKQGRISWSEYTERYQKLMDQSKEQWPEEWSKLKALDKVALACYCPAGANCHRHLLMEIVFRDLHKEGVDAVYMGELE